MRFFHDIGLSARPAAGFVAIGLYWGSFAALVPALKPQVGLGDGQFGLAMLVSTCGAILAMWLAPQAEQRLGKRALPLLAAAMALAFLLPGLTGGGVAFALAMMGGAMTSGTLDVVMNAEVSRLEARHRRPLMNLNHGLFSVAYALAALVSGVMREAGRTPFEAFAAMGVVTIGLIGVMLRRRGAPPEEVAAPDEIQAAPLAPVLLVLGGGIILIAFMAEQATEAWSALHLERNLGAGAVAGALGPAILGATMAAGRFAGQGMAMRLSEPHVIGWGGVLSALGAVIAAHAPVLWVAYLGFAILGLGVSVMAPMGFAWIGRLVSNRHRTHAISRISAIGFTGFFVGPPMMGFLSEAFGLPWSFTAIALALLTVPLALVPMLRRRSG